MNKELYYTPTIEEFHIGFQYELHNGDEWEKHNFPGTYTLEVEDWYRLLEEKVKLQIVRVKYLDKEDIESLKWKLIKEYESPYTKNTLYNFHINEERGFNTGSHYYLNLLDNNKIVIEIRTYGSYDTFNFKMEFNINNKSELIKLMKQLGI